MKTKNGLQEYLNVQKTHNLSLFFINLLHFYSIRDIILINIIIFYRKAVYNGENIMYNKVPSNLDFQSREKATEKFWTEKVPHTNWFKRCARTYQIWTWHDYTEALDPGFFDRCEKNLLRCRNLAPAGIHRERAEYFLCGFRDRRFKIEYYLKNRMIYVPRILPRAWRK